MEEERNKKNIIFNNVYNKEIKIKIKKNIE